MKLTKILSLIGLSLIFALAFPAPYPVLAQEGQPDTDEGQPLLVYTQYPSRIIGFGESVSFPLKLIAGDSQMVDLQIEDAPEGWTASFQGGSDLIDAVYVKNEDEVTVNLRLEPSEDAAAGTYELTVVATGEGERSELPVSLTIQEKLPPRLSLEVDGLPVKRGGPSSSFTFRADLNNEGGEDLLVELSATQPQNMQITIESGGQEVTELELPANESKSLTIKADPLIDLEAGEHAFTVRATAGDVQTELPLTVHVVGEGSLRVTGPEGRLSGQAYAGQENPLKVVLTNDGTAPLRGVELTSSEPNGWSVTFDQPQIAEIPPGESVEVTARITPPEKAVAGDYMVQINARPLDHTMESADFRITVRTSTLWGVAGVGLIALAVGVVGVAVFRFGRR